MPSQRLPPPPPSASTDRPSPVPLSSNPSFASSASTDSTTSGSDASSLASPFEKLHLQDSPSPFDSQKPPQDVEDYHPLVYEIDSDVNMLERSRVSTPSSPSYHTRPLLQHYHTQTYPRSSGSPAPDRPTLPHRNTSFSKRTASFDSPREVPLPYMPSQIHNATFSPSSSRILCADANHAPPSPGRRDMPLDGMRSGAGSPSALRRSPAPIDHPPQTESPSPQYMDVTDDEPAQTSPSDSNLPERTTHHQYRRNLSGPVQLYGRPASSPEASGSAPHIHSPKPVRAVPPELSSRSSTLSLPLPSHTPYHTLPPAQGSSSGTIPEEHAAMPPLPSTSSMHAAASYPSTSQRAEYMENYRSALAAGQPDWLREFSEPRRMVSPSSLNSDRLPEPAPPTVLTPPPPPRTDAGSAHEPFLSHAPPPQDSYIAVETSASEYRLIINLPGYRRDSITLSTRRRRILHVVADSWEPGGGHFERRISFGYDADLAQVRAEFDGELLRIIVPRRAPPMTYWGTRI